MRNLKKFLALTLAMMMVLGLMVTANASTFTDNGDINAKYAVAADVLNTLGVLKGYSTSGGTSFRPNGDILRQEFATILYRIHSGDADELYVDDYIQYADFSDVKSTDWFAGAVGYCQSKGLLKGNPDGTYSPEGKVTGVQVVTGMLRALGYDQDGTKLTGSTYGTMAMILGNEAGIVQTVGTKNLTEKAATRQEVAQVAFDTLTADVVYWEEGNGHYTGNTQTNPGLTLGEMNFELEVYADSASIAALKLPADPFNRPAPTYVVVADGAVIYSENGATASYNGDFTARTAETYQDDFDGGKIKLYYNGVDATDWEDSMFEGDTGDGGGMWIDNDNNNGIHGMQIEVYKHVHGEGCDTAEAGDPDDPVEYTCTYEKDIVVAQANLGRITNINKTTGAITVTAYIAGGNAAGKEIEVAKDSSAVYKALSAHAKDDYVALYMEPGTMEAESPDGDNLVAVAELTPVVAEITDKTVDTKFKSKGALFSGDTKYEWDELAVLREKTSKDFKTTPVMSLTKLDYATLYMLNNYVLFVDQSEIKTTGGYAYLYGVRYQWEDESGSSGDIWSDEIPNDVENSDDGDIYVEPEEGEYDEVRMLLADNSWVQVDATDEDGIINTVLQSTLGLGLVDDAGFGALVYYTVDAYGVYHLTGITGKAQNKGLTGELKVEQGVAEGVIPGNAGKGLDIEYNDDTVFFKITVDDKGQVVKNQSRAYTGIDNVPDITVKDGTYVAAAAVDENGSVKASGAANEECVTALLVEESPIEVATGAGEYFIVVPADAPVGVTKGPDGEEMSFYLLNAVVNGKVTQVKVKAELIATKSVDTYTITQSGIVFISSVAMLKGSGVIVGTRNTTVNYLDKGAVQGDGVTNVNGGNITITGVTVGESSVDKQYRVSKLNGVFEFDLTAGTVEEIKATDIKAENDYENAIGMADSTGNFVLELFVSEDDTVNDVYNSGTWVLVEDDE